MATEIALLAGGCFWGMEELLRALPGVLDTEVGYTGGATPNPTYATVKTGKTGHAEALRLTFDPAVVSFTEILALFFRIHDPTTRHRQGNDVGSQYRSAIFYTSETQRSIAERVIADPATIARWNAPIVTELIPAAQFYPAEPYHQDYLQHTPAGYTCHFVRP